MSFLRQVFDGRRVLDLLGVNARASARDAGVNSYHIDPEHSGVILVEHPNGEITIQEHADVNRRKVANG